MQNSNDRVIDFRAFAGYINNYQKANQEQVKAAQLSSDDIITVWQSFGQDSSCYGIYAQRMDGFGNKIGEELRINSCVKNNQSNPTIASLSDGGFIIAWQSFDQDGSGYGIYAQRFDSSGHAIKEEFQVNSYTKNHQSNPVVTALSDGGFIIAWQSFAQDSSSYGIYAQRFDSSGNPIDKEFQVNNYIKNHQSNPTITALTDGSFIIAWQSFDQDGSGYGIYAKRFDKSGAVIKEEFQVNSYTKNHQSNPTITALTDSSFIIAWQSFDQGWNGYGIYAKKFNAAGDQVGDEFLISNSSQYDQKFVSASSFSDGYALAWQSWNQDTKQYDIYMHQYWNDKSDKEIRIMGSNSHSSAQHPIIISLANNGSAIFIESTAIQGKNIIGYISDVIPTNTPTLTMTQSIIVTPTFSPTAAASLTSGATVNFTPSITPSSSISDSTTASNTTTISPTATASLTPSIISSISVSDSYTGSVTDSSSITPTIISSATATNSESEKISPTNSIISAATYTSSVSSTPTITSSVSVRGTERPSITESAMSATQSITMTPVISASSSLRITNTVSVFPTSSIITSSSATKSNTSSTNKNPEVSATPSYTAVLLTVSPTPSAYMVQSVTGGGEYTGTATRDNFVINVNEDTTITGGSGDDVFTIQTSSRNVNDPITITITDFDVTQEKMDLSQLPNIKSMNDFSITSGSAIIHLPSQNIRLLHLTPEELSENNFIFSSPKPSHSNDFNAEDILITASVLSTAVLVGIIWIGYKLYHHRKKIIPEPSDEENGGVIAKIVGLVEEKATEIQNLYPVMVEVVEHYDVAGEGNEITGAQPEIY